MPGQNLTRDEAQVRREAVSHVRYIVHLDLTKGAQTFVSTTKISFDAGEGTSTFLDLVAPRVKSILLNGTPLDVETSYRDSRIALSGLSSHNEVEIVAVCEYSHTGEGLHRSVDPSDGNVYLYTQFEVPDARRVYAVFDQPDIKGVFNFSVTAPASWEVISNMPAASEEIEGQTEPGTLERGAIEGVKKWEFSPTPRMSSYLTAFIAGPYASWHTEYANEDGRTIPMGMYCRQALKDAMSKDVDYLFDITKRGFAFYAKTWGVPYPYAKYDQIYVPEYNAGAMENIGAVTIRDTYVFESKVTDAYAERRVVTVLHELAHMWFGDLVTMKWWNDLWLNESFAEFMSTLASAEATDWSDAWATFTSGEKSWGQGQDQLPTTHPIAAPINDLNDTQVNFDGITYAKGASVLKQLVAYVGREQFFQGIHNYLTKYSYGNATLADLLAELEKTSGRDLKTWSKLWIEQSGINTIATEVETDDSGVITAFALRQTAPDAHPVLRPHRLKVGFYDLDASGSGAVVRTDSVELDIEGEVTQVPELVGRKRPGFILVNDDDLTYAKLRFDAESVAFLEQHLYAFDDALARAVSWLTLWDMTRDGEYPAEKFIGVSLKALSTEKESTTFRYALSQVEMAARHYVANRRRADVLTVVASSLWTLANEAAPGSDEQFQLVSAYLTYGTDAEFEDHARGLLSGQLQLNGLDVDNNLRWSILVALADKDLLADGEIDRELAARDTTENRQFAYQAKAQIPSADAKEWAWNTALTDDSLTNAQIEGVSSGFSSTDRPELYAGYVSRFFDQVEWIWKNKSFHMAEVLLVGTNRGYGLYPGFAAPSALVEAGEKWLTEHPGADRALRRMVIENLETSKRNARVQSYNALLQ
ncbi:MAG: aminopeptidase N [Bifidobacteriaceae bacterium]|jgi:aminopeptidase N|nr:aminopeptidase N [Bifidobacteriaceae bacterium]